MDIMDRGDKASIIHGTLKYATASLIPTCVLRGNKFWVATWALLLHRKLCWDQMRQHADTQNKKNKEKSSYHKVLFNLRVSVWLPQLVSRTRYFLFLLNPFSH